MACIAQGVEPLCAAQASAVQWHPVDKAQLPLLTRVERLSPRRIRHSRNPLLSPRLDPELRHRSRALLCFGRQRRRSVSHPEVTTASRRSRTAGVASSSELRRFVATFAAEQVLEVESALDAIQQAQARGASDVISIVRVA